MIVYRISKEKYHKDISGIGSRIYGGRWNYKGFPTLYTSETRALCTLELLVHTDNDLLPPNLKLLSIEIPLLEEEIVSVQIKDLPKKWRKSPPLELLKMIGKKNLIDQNKLAIKVPSVIIPDEYNVVINPLHEDFKDVKIEKAENYKIDIRLLK